MFLGSMRQLQAAQICTTSLDGIGPSSSTGAAATLSRSRGSKSLCPMWTPTSLWIQGRVIGLPVPVQVSIELPVMQGLGGGGGKVDAGGGVGWLSA